MGVAIFFGFVVGFCVGVGSAKLAGCKCQECLQQEQYDDWFDV